MCYNVLVLQHRALHIDQERQWQHYNGSAQSRRDFLPLRIAVTHKKSDGFDDGEICLQDFRNNVGFKLSRRCVFSWPAFRPQQRVGRRGVRRPGILREYAPSRTLMTRL